MNNLYYYLRLIDLKKNSLLNVSVNKHGTKLHLEQQIKVSYSLSQIILIQPV